MENINKAIFDLSDKSCKVVPSIVEDFKIRVIASDDFHLTAKLNDNSINIEDLMGGNCLIDLTDLILVNQVVTLEVIGIDDLGTELHCKAYLLTYNNSIVILPINIDKDIFVGLLNTHLSNYKALAIGLYAVIKHEDEPFCKLPQMLLSLGIINLDELSQIIGYGLQVLEIAGIKTFFSQEDVIKELQCFSVPRDAFESIFFEVLNILDFPITSSICLTTQKPIEIDLSELVSNHKENFIYEISEKDIIGSFKQDNYVINYEPTEMIWSYKIKNTFTYKVTSSTGRVSQGTVSISFS